MTSVSRMLNRLRAHSPLLSAGLASEIKMDNILTVKIPRGLPRGGFKVPDEVADLIRGLHPHLKKKLKKALHAIATEPHSGKPLKDEPAGLRSYRLSRFRIIYRISPASHVEIVAVGPRQRIYEETFRIISRQSETA